MNAFSAYISRLTKQKCLVAFLLTNLAAVLAGPAQGQTYNNFLVNSGVNATTPESKSILSLWDEYLSSKFKNQRKFWLPNELDKYEKGDLLLSEGFIQPNVYSYNTAKSILSITKVDSVTYGCKTLFCWQNPDESKNLNITIFCIINIYFYKQNNQWFLVNNLTNYTSKWKKEQAGSINYWLPYDTPFNKKNAFEANEFLGRIFKDFEIAPFQVSYYIAPTCDQIQTIKGFDYVVGMGSSSICGFYDSQNHIVYAGGLNENYLHELVHVINPYFPKAHSLFLTGYSAVRGGHFGQSIDYHKKRMLSYLKTHEIDLTNPLSFNTLDEKTNPQYVIGGLFCEYALRLGGIPKLKQLFSYGTSDEEFYKALYKELNLKKEDLPKFILKQLAKN